MKTLLILVIAVLATHTTWASSISLRDIVAGVEKDSDALKFPMITYSTPGMVHLETHPIFPSGPCTSIEQRGTELFCIPYRDPQRAFAFARITGTSRASEDNWQIIHLFLYPDLVILEPYTSTINQRREYVLTILPPLCPRALARKKLRLEGQAGPTVVSKGAKKKSK